MQTRNVAKAISEKNFAKAMSLRDPEFAETLDGFDHTSQLAKEPYLPIHKVRSVGWISLRNTGSHPLASTGSVHAVSV